MFKLLDKGFFLKHGMDKEFTLDEMADVYVDIISLMTKCDTVPVHRAKTKALCVQWVKIRRNGKSSAQSHYLKPMVNCPQAQFFYNNSYKSFMHFKCHPYYQSTLFLYLIVYILNSLYT
ncbi:hypothetical protein BDN67DRAFT_984802 [Paxillus ammoniavirescens]|nr:hypothetical protein BDN67DRAFT_984802 [Paxillus ammoniavirescens]